jgi:hypothetical protein
MNLYALQHTVTPAHSNTAHTSTLATCTAGTMAQAMRKLHRNTALPPVQPGVQLKVVLSGLQSKTLIAQLLGINHAKTKKIFAY